MSLAYLRPRKATSARHLCRHPRAVATKNFFVFKFMQPHSIIFASIASKTAARRSNVVLDGGLERGRVRTNNLADLLAVLEEEESGHGADGELLSDVWKLVYVELVEARVGVVIGKPLYMP